MPILIAVDIDTLPSDRFVKAGKSACIRQEENPRHTMCHATGYTREPEFQDKKSDRYVSQYCTDCQEAYRKETGNFAQSAAD